MVLPLLNPHGHWRRVNFFGDDLKLDPVSDPVLQNRAIIEGGRGVAVHHVVPHRVGGVEVLHLKAVLVLNRVSVNGAGGPGLNVDGLTL